MERIVVSVQEGYERWAPTYDREPNPVLRVEERQLALMLPSLQGKRVLDLACGTGRWLGWLMAEGAGAGAGVDLSPAMLGQARRKAALTGRLVEADCEAIPFADAIFDVVVCSFAVAQINDLRRVAREVARVATLEADVFVTDLHPDAYAQGWQTGFRDDRGAVEIATFCRSTQEFLAAWTSAGFDCAQMVECRFGERDRAALSQAGKATQFEALSGVPAVLICHFQRPRRPAAWLL